VSSSTSNSQVRFFLPTYLVAVFLFYGFMAAVVPIFGWDVLGDWNNEWGRAYRSLILTGHITEYNSEYFRSFRHSDLLTAPFVFSVFLLKSKYFSFVGVMWALLAFASVLFLIYGTSESRKASLSSLFALLLLVTPIYENHALVAGYSELAVGLLLLMLYWVYFSKSTPVFSAAALFSLMVLLVMSKSSGVLYLIAGLYAYFSIKFLGVFIKSKKLIFAAACLFELIALRIFYAFVDQFWLEKSIRFTGRNLVIVKNDFGDVFYNTIFMLIVNSSFSVLFLGLAIIFISTLVLNYKEEVLVLFRMIFVTFLTVFSGMLFVDVFYAHSAVNADTSATRFLIPIIPVSILAIWNGVACLKGMPRCKGSSLTNEIENGESKWS